MFFCGETLKFKGNQVVNQLKVEVIAAENL